MFEAYKIGITLALVNNVTSGLLALSHDFRRTGTDAAALEKRIASINTQLARGALMTKAGMGLIGMFKSPIEEAKKFQSEVMRFQALGLGDAATSEATKFAKGMDVMGQSARDNMKLLREATAIMGDLHHAELVAPFLAKLKFGVEAGMGEGHGEKFDTQLQAILKTSELRGALVNRDTGQIDVDKFKHSVNLMTQAYVASGGLVKPSDYLAAMKTGGVSTKMMSDDMFYFGLGHFMQESGGSRTGTASMTLFNQIAQGTMSQRVAELLQKEHLLNAGSIHYGKTGHITKVDGMGVKGSQEFVGNSFDWVNNVVIPQLIANGHKKGQDLDLALSSLFGVRTAKGLADAFMREAPAARLYMERAKKAANGEQLYGLAGGTLQGKEQDLQAKWRDLMRELGTTVLPLAIRGVEKLISIIKPLSAWVESHPEKAKYFVDSLIVLAGALVVGGIAQNVLAIAGLVRLLGGSAVASGVATAATGLAAGARNGAAAGAAASAIRGGGMLAQAGAGVAGVLLAPEVLAAVAVAGAGYMAYKGYKYYHPDKATEKNTTVNLNVDGKKMATVVVDHMGREISRPNAGTTGPDHSYIAPKPVGGVSR